MKASVNKQNYKDFHCIVPREKVNVELSKEKLKFHEGYIVAVLELAVSEYAAHKFQGLEKNCHHRKNVLDPSTFRAFPGPYGKKQTYILFGYFKIYPARTRDSWQCSILKTHFSFCLAYNFAATSRRVAEGAEQSGAVWERKLKGIVHSFHMAAPQEFAGAFRKYCRLQDIPRAATPCEKEKCFSGSILAFIFLKTSHCSRGVWAQLQQLCARGK
ncbi:hypothetical protein Anapl_04374 [Anas platyrhynchos]|uniref:Uncharacterized protein n=1 Tax=Anas platyrhynchos TaxID=8839 RepID=R0LSJ6_ANAPL|nr:hypothetical protein Anapl_04374 [Anas platyrhynchos]